jgi:transcriptional regulator with PAS, ATPase and Fis domain
MVKPIRGLSGAAQQKLLAHHWPGNVRELRNVIERAVILEGSEEIQASSLPEFHLEAGLRKGGLPTVPGNQPLDEVVAQFEKEFILNILAQNRYNLLRTAAQLQISRHALRYRMQRLNIETGPESEDEAPQAVGRETKP